MEEADDDYQFGAPPPWITLSSFPSQISPSPRRLSSHFTPPTRPVRAARQLAWVSLQGRIVGAEEASSAKSIGGGMSAEEAVAWELFSPMHRILIVAVIAVAAANSKKNKQILQLTKSVEIRDQVLLGMQQKLDNLCDQVNYLKDQPDISPYNFKFAGCGCRLCDCHQLPSKSLECDHTTKAANEDDMVTDGLPLQCYIEPEERRMSDLSDWAPSVSSSVDLQCNSSSVEQDIRNLRKECEDKDAKIKKLSVFLSSGEAMGSKRIAELEDVIRRKNMIITKLKKDIVVLEHKVVHFARLRRPSFSKSGSSWSKLPVMTGNPIYDMDSTTSPSSSDSDCSAKKKHSAPMLKNKNKDGTSLMKNEKEQNADILKDNNVLQCKADTFVGKPKSAQPKSSDLTIKSSERPPTPINPLKEKSLNQQLPSVALSRSKVSLTASGDHKSRRNGTTTNSRVSASQKRWV